MTRLHTSTSAARALDAAEAREWATRIGRRLLRIVELQLVGRATHGELTRWRALYRNAVLVARKYERAAQS